MEINTSVTSVSDNLAKNQIFNFATKDATTHQPCVDSIFDVAAVGWQRDHDGNNAIVTELIGQAKLQGDGAGVAHEFGCVGLIPAPNRHLNARSAVI